MYSWLKSLRYKSETYMNWKTAQVKLLSTKPDCFQKNVAVNFASSNTLLGDPIGTTGASSSLGFFFISCSFLEKY